MPTVNMANTDLSDKYKDMEAEEILATLTEEELEQIANEMDPDVSRVGKWIKVMTVGLEGMSVD